MGGGGGGGFALTPFETKSFNFHREFSEETGKLIDKQSCYINKSNRLCKFEPPIKKSWICTCIDIFWASQV